MREPLDSMQTTHSPCHTCAHEARTWPSQPLHLASRQVTDWPRWLTIWPSHLLNERLSRQTPPRDHSSPCPLRCPAATLTSTQTDRLNPSVLRHTANKKAIQYSCLTGQWTFSRVVMIVRVRPMWTRRQCARAHLHPTDATAWLQPRQRKRCDHMLFAYTFLLRSRSVGQPWRCADKPQRGMNGLRAGGCSPRVKGVKSCCTWVTSPVINSLWMTLIHIGTRIIRLVHPTWWSAYPQIHSKILTLNTQIRSTQNIEKIN